MTYEETQKLAELYLKHPLDDDKIKDELAKHQKQVEQENHKRTQSFIKHFIPTEISDPKELNEKVREFVNSSLKPGYSVDFSLSTTDPMKTELVMTLWKDTPTGYEAKSCSANINPGSITQPNALALELALKNLPGMIDNNKLDALLDKAKEKHQKALETETTLTTTMRKSK
ncbi:MAG TPA: hypothetical protein VM577_15290 [Anaerovoracaceae bacterium]|nr:hypothetical protein [Anaerovoracaceae bacterium]